MFKHLLPGKDRFKYRVGIGKRRCARRSGSAHTNTVTGRATTAWIWFPESRQLTQWSLEPRPSGAVSVRGDPDEVLSIGVNSGSVQFAVRRWNGVWIVNQDGSAAGALPRDVSAVMLIPGGAVYATRTGIAIHDLEIPIEGVTAFSWMSASYLQVRAGGAIYALRIDPGRETLFQLPGVPQ